MIPILYASTETVKQLVADQTNGLGRLADAITCKVQEDRNGAFTLSMTYPISGIHYADVVIGSCIRAKPNDLADPQLFRIYHISKPLNGVVTIDAQHISYDLSKAVVKPFSAKGITAVTSGMISNMIGGIGFSFSSDINNGDSQFTNDHPQSFRALLGGQEGSVLDVFGGEYEFNNEKVILHAHRGSDNGVVIRYGKNLTSVQQDENIESTYTAVYPYVLNSDHETIAGDLQTVVSTSEPKILALDLSSEFKEEDGTPTAAQINAKAQEYIKANNIGVPKVSLDVSFVQLWQTQEYKEIAPLERVSLCDTVTVKYEKLGVDAKAKVITTVYDVLAERYDSITLGDAKSSLASTIAAAPEREAIEKQTSSDLERAVTRATKLITGQKGGHVVIKSDVNGKPQELLIMDTEDETTATKVWRWNLSGLGYSSKGVNGEYGTAITQDGAIVADYITTGDLNAQVITTGILKDRKGLNYWNLDTGDFRLEDIGAAMSAASKAQDTADGKRRVFVTQPVPPYDKGDLWCTGSAGDILTCMTAKASGESYAVSDWQKLNKYTDDSAVKALDNKLNSSEEIFNRLTNNGTVQGITMQDGNLYINAAYILAGVLAGFTLDFNLANNPTRLDGGHYSMYDYVDGETKTIYGLFVHAKNDADEYKNALLVNGAFNLYSRDLPARLAVGNEHHLDIQFGSTKRHINNRGTGQDPKNPGLYITNDTGGSCYIALTENAKILIHADNGLFVNDTQPVRGPLSHLVTCQYNSSNGCLDFFMDGTWVGSTKK